MHSTDDLTFMRQTQTDALPGTAVIYSTLGTVSDGQGGFYDGTVAIGTVPARLYPRTNRIAQESAANGAQVISLTQWWITMPWDTTVDASHRISMDGRTWEIQSLNNDEHWRTAIRCQVNALNEENRF